MTEPVTLGYNQVEKTYVVSNQSKTTIFENESLKKALKDYSNHIKVESSPEIIDTKKSDKKTGRKSTKSS